MPPREHARQFKEMLCIAELLPAGKTPTPSEKLALQWYYMTYHHADHAEYVKSGKKLASKTIKSLTNYFQALFSQKKLMARSNVPRSIVCAILQKKRLASNLRKKRKARRLGYVRHELPDCAQHDNNQSYC
jgi:hypothetical protein